MDELVVIEVFNRNYPVFPKNTPNRLNKEAKALFKAVDVCCIEDAEEITKSLSRKFKGAMYNVRRYREGAPLDWTIKVWVS